MPRAAGGAVIATVVRLNAFGIRRVETFRGIFPMRNKRVDATPGTLVAAFAVTRVSVVLVWAFVSVLTVPVMLALHCRVTST